MRFHWDVLAFVAGRGAGKTFKGAELTNEFVRTRPGAQIGLVGSTTAAVKDLMVVGQSGLMITAPCWNRPYFQRATGRVLWPNGAIGYIYSPKTEDEARSRRHSLVWADDLVDWVHQGDKVWRHLKRGLQLPAARPQLLVTTGLLAKADLMRLMVDDLPPLDGRVTVMVEGVPRG
jgi:phage terminase large subunit-like protein